MPDYTYRPEDHANYPGGTMSPEEAKHRASMESFARHRAATSVEPANGAPSLPLSIRVRRLEEQVRGLTERLDEAFRLLERQSMQLQDMDQHLGEQVDARR
jgi:hypothetical protein